MSRDRSLDIAVVGMSGRFPGAADVAELWEAVDEGRILTSRLTPSQVLAAGVPAEVCEDPAYVPVHGRLDDADRFDHAFFGISPREAHLLDPQQRLLLECAWTALEDAGHPFGCGDPLRTGVYAAASSSEHLRALLGAGELEAPEFEEAILANERDFLATRIAYKLDLTGPALTVLTACSSSLVAVHTAIQALNNGECDQAVVLAASANAPQAGHLHMAGGVLSAGGVCRPFDAAADGALSGSGAIAVVLRRYEDTVDAGLPVHGVLLGSAVNNDGSAKAGFLAPSTTGQERVIRSAVAAADIDASSIGYLETHGTGTRIGDPIEWAAASAAYRSMGAWPGQIPIGALKGTIGHLDAAAGLAGLVKALLVVKHGRIPAVPGLTEPNPLLEQEDSPLRAPLRAEPWSGPEPRRAAVSSFGVGGTNAHVLVEQAPVITTSTGGAPAEEGREHLVVLSAAEPEALGRMRTRLAQHLEDGAGGPAGPADISATLAGRAVLPHRFAAAASTTEELVRVLRDPARLQGIPAAPDVPLVFLLPGQGTQTPGMALALSVALPGFDRHLEDCLRAFSPGLAEELQRALHDPEFPAAALAETRLAQPALFAVSYSAGTALRELGLTPSVLAGHSLGELSGACLAGTLDLASAARLVEHRGRLMQDCAPGAMLSLACSEGEAEALVAELEADLSVAAVNTRTDTVLAGSVEAVEAFRDRLAGRVETRRLRTTRAFHSAYVDPAVSGLRELLAETGARTTEIAWVGNADGKLVPEGAAVDLMRFADSARLPVRFADVLETVRANFPGALAVEVGPGRVLSALAETAGLPSVPLLAPPRATGAPLSVLGALGELWSAGAPLDIGRLQAPGRHVHLPGYPFLGPRHPAPGSRPRPAAPLRDTTDALPGGLGTEPVSPAATGPESEDAAGIVRELWHEQLGLSPAAGDADFFDLGGDSLSAARLARRMGQRFDVEVPVRALLSARSLDEQTALVERLLIEQILSEGQEIR